MEYTIYYLFIIEDFINPNFLKMTIAKITGSISTEKTITSYKKSMDGVLIYNEMLKFV